MCRIALLVASFLIATQLCMTDYKLIRLTNNYFGGLKISSRIPITSELLEPKEALYGDYSGR